MKKDARNDFQRVVELDSDNTSDHINYAIVLVALYRWQDAITQLAPVARAKQKRFIARTMPCSGGDRINQPVHEGICGHSLL
jgi:hypothetical protein